MRLRITILLFLAFLSNSAIAQTGEDCASPFPVNYPIIGSGTAECGIYNNVGATTDVSTVTFNPLFLNCPPNDNEVWFQFIPTPPLYDLVITVEGVQDGAIPPMVMPRITVVLGDCATVLEATACAEAAVGTGSTTLTLPAASQIPNFPLYIIVSDWSTTAASNEGAFELCLRELTEVTIPPTGGTFDNCSGIVHDTGGPMGNYMDNESYTIDICPTDAFSCLELNITYDLEPYDGFSGDFLEIEGFVPDLPTTPVTLTTLTGVNPNGVTVLSTGCVSIDFQSDGGVNQGGFTIDWSCNQDICYNNDATNQLAVNPVITPDTVCLGQCVTLTANPVDIQETTDYALSQIDYNPFPFIGANEVTVNSDDQWSQPIGLPFDFCFYGGTYSQVTLGSNGVVSFDVANYAGNFNAWAINDPIPGNNNVLNSILCPYHDINPASGGGFYFSVFGTAPFRVAVFSFNDVNAFSCQITSTQQVALYESTNVIETYISNKTLCSTWNGGASIHGIQNALGNQAVVVDDGVNVRNFPTQWTASNDAWRFTPDGTTNVQTTTVWYDGENNLIGNGETVNNVCPSETEIYRAEVTYADILCSNTTFTLADSAQVVVTTQGVFPYEVSDDVIICAGESIAIGGAPTPGVTYTWMPTTDLDLTDPANPVASPSSTITYYLVANDTGCSLNDSVTVTVVQDPTPMITGVFQICVGASTTIDAGTGYSDYLWSTNETTQTIDANALGDYSVTVTLSAGCTGVGMVTITNASDLMATVAGVTENSCTNSNGAIDTEITVGIPPFSYNWTGDAAGQDADPIGLSAGDYTVTITDGAGCTATLMATVPQQAQVVASVDMDTVCIGDLVQLDAVGGNGTYLWSASNGGVSNPNIANPTANPTTTTTYYVISETNSGNLVVNGDFEAGDTGFTSNYVLGTGGAFGDLSNPATYGIYTSPDIGHINFDPCTDHTSGTGNMMVVNGSDIAQQNIWCQTVTVTPNTDYNFSAWLTSAVLGNPAELQFEINGNSLGNTFTLQNATCNWQEYNTIWNSGANTSAVICILNQNTSGSGNDFALDDITFSEYCTQGDSITVYVSEPLATITDNNSDFCGSGQGSLTVEGTGGYGDFTYEWTPNAGGQTAAIASGLAGNDVYFVTITDSYGCSTLTSAFLQDLGTIPAEITGDLIICPGESSILTAGPVAYDSYLWSDAAGTTTVDLSVTMPGDYTVTVTSGTCTGTAMVTVTSASNPSPSITGDLILCSASTTTLDAGAGYDTYTWSDGSSNQTLDVTVSGDYTVVVTNSDGCAGTDMVTVSFGDLPVTITGETGLCLGESTTLSANTQGVVTWLDNNNMVVANGPSLNLTPVAEGSFTYTATAFDNNCSSSETVTITVGTIPTLTTSMDMDICAGETANISATTDLGTLSWAAANEFADPSLANQTVSPNGTTTYVVTADNNGCEATATVNINVDAAPIYGVLDDTEICNGQSVAIGLLNDSGTTYSWVANPADPSLTDASAAMPFVTPTVTTTYTLTATNGLCTETDMVTITVVSPSISVAEIAPICSGDEATFVATTSPAGGTVTWADWEGNVLATGGSFSAFPWQSTSYSASYEINGCSVATVFVVTVVATPSLVTTATDSEINQGESSLLNVAGATAGSTYVWTDLLNDETLADNSASVTVSPTQTTTYQVDITSPEGCLYTEFVTVFVRIAAFDIPNIFTPNGDGLNDEFYPVDVFSLEVLEFKIFDRWGEMVHDNVSQGWQGKQNGDDLPADIYVYFIKVKYDDGTEELRKGDVALVR